jgi:hypothetical protein
MSISIRSALRRGGVAVLSGSLLVATGLVLGGPAPSAQAHEADPLPVQLGAGWLERELTGGLIHDDQFNFDDFGATVEAAYALDTVGDRDKMGSIISALRANADAYTSPGDEVWAGSTGKLLSFVEDLTTANPRTFGDVDLVAQLEGVTAPSGRIADVSSFGDFTNTFGQAWAARGLSLVGSSEAPAALDFLLDLQCGPGYFHLDFSDSCSDPVPPVDTAAAVVVLLSDLVPADPAQAADLDAAVADAVAWIKTRQAGNGSFDGGTATEGANANSTGLAGWALNITDEHEAAEAAATWIRGRQVAGLRCDRKLKDEFGAIAYDQKAYDAALADGITTPVTGQWRFATIQALPALLAAPASEDDLSFRGLPSFLDGGEKVTFTVTGLAPGERACAQIGGRTGAVVGRPDGTARARVQVPNRTGFVGVQVNAAQAGVGTESVSLAAKRVRFERDAVVGARGQQTVVVRSLFVGERVVVRYDGDRVARGIVNNRGVFRTTFGVGREKGSHRIRVVGQFADRAGTRSFDVR